MAALGVRRPGLVVALTLGLLAWTLDGFMAPLPAYDPKWRVAPASRRVTMCAPGSDAESTQQARRWPWQRWTLRLRRDGSVTPSPEEQEASIALSTAQGRPIKQTVKDFMTASGIVVAAVFRNAPPWDKGLGVNPTPATFLQIYGPYIFTILFLTFGLRGLEPLRRFLYDRSKRRKQESRMAKPKKNKAKYYRTPSKLYDLAKSKLEAASEATKEAEVADVEGEEGEAVEEEVKEEEPKLSAFRCEVCSFTLYPAKGREFKFFSDTFKCPSCGAKKDKFYDLTDEDDPRNQEQPAEQSDDTVTEDDLGDADSLTLGDDDADAPAPSSGAETASAPEPEGRSEEAAPGLERPPVFPDDHVASDLRLVEKPEGGATPLSSALLEDARAVVDAVNSRSVTGDIGSQLYGQSSENVEAPQAELLSDAVHAEKAEEDETSDDHRASSARRIVLGDGGATPRSNGTSSAARPVMPVFALNLSAGGSDGGREHAEEDARSSALMADAIMGVATAAALAAPRARAEERTEGRVLEGDSVETGSQLDTRGWRADDRSTQLKTRVKKQGLSFTIKIDVQVDDDDDDERLEDQERQQQPARALWLGQARPMPAPSAVDVVTKDNSNSADDVDTALTSVVGPPAVEPRNVTGLNDVVTYIGSPLAKDEGFGEEVERRLPEGTVNVSWLGSLPSFAQLFTDEYIPTEKEIAEAKAKMDAEAKLREMGGVPETDVLNVRAAADEEYVDESVEEMPQEQWDEAVEAPLDDAPSEVYAEPAVVDEWASEPLPEFERQADDNEGGFRRMSGGDVEYEPEPQDALMADGELERREGESEFADDVARRPASTQDVREVAKEVAEEAAEEVAAVLSDALDTITSDDVKESGRADDVEASSSSEPSKDVLLDAAAKPEEEKRESADVKGGEATAASDAPKDDEDAPPTTPLNTGAVIDFADTATVDDVETSRVMGAAADPLGEASEPAARDDSEAPEVNASAHEVEEQGDEVAVSAEAAEHDSQEQASDADTAPQAEFEFTASVDADESAPADDVEAAPQRGAKDLLSTGGHEEGKEEHAETPVAESTTEVEKEEQKDDAPELSKSTDASMDVSAAEVAEERIVDEDKPAETADVRDEENEAVSSQAFETAEAEETASSDDVEPASGAEASGDLLRGAEAGEEKDEGSETSASQAASDEVELVGADASAAGQEPVIESADDSVAAEPEPVAEEAAVRPEEPADAKKHVAPSSSDPASDDWVHPYASEGTVADDDVESVEDTPKLTNLSRFRKDDPLHHSRAPADAGHTDDAASAPAAPVFQTTSNADRDIEGPEPSSTDNVARVAAEAEQTETEAPAEEKAEAGVAEQSSVKDEVVAPPKNFFGSRWHEPERRRRSIVEPEPVSEDDKEAAPEPVKDEQLLSHGDASPVEESVVEQQPEVVVDEHKLDAEAGLAMPHRSRWHDDDDDRKSARRATRVREMEPVEDEPKAVADDNDVAPPQELFTTTAGIERDETASADDVEASLHAEPSSDLLLDASQDVGDKGAESMVAESAEERNEADAEPEHTDERDDTTDEDVVMPEPTASDEDAQEQRSIDDVAFGEPEQPRRSRWRDNDDGRKSARRAESRDVVDEHESVKDELGAPSAPALFKTTAPTERDETVSADDVEVSLPAESSADVLLGGTEKQEVDEGTDSLQEGDEGTDSLLAASVDDDAADFKPVDVEQTDAEPSTDASSETFKTSFSSDEAMEPGSRDDVAGDGPLQSSSESEREEHEGSMDLLSQSQDEEPERSSGDEETETAAEAEESNTDDAEAEQGLGVVSRDDVTPEHHTEEATVQHSGRSSRWRHDDDRLRSRAAADHAEVATIGDMYGASRPSESKGEDADAPAEQELDGQAFETTSLSADVVESPSTDEVEASSKAAADDNNADFIKLDASAVAESEEPRRSRWRDMDERPSARLSKDALEIFRVVDRLERETDKPLRAVWLGPIGRRAEAFVEEADEGAEPIVPDIYVQDSNDGLLDAEPAVESLAPEPVAEQEEKETVHDEESKGDMLDTDAQELPKEPQPVFYALEGAENELLKDEIDPSVVSKSLSRWQEGDERPKNPAADVLLAEGAHDAEAAAEQSSADEVEAPADASTAQAHTSVHEEAELSADVVAASPGEARYDLLFDQPALPAAEEGVDDFLLAAPGAHDEVDSVESEPVLADDEGENVGDAEPAGEETVSDDIETASAATSCPSESLELRQEEDRLEEEAGRPLADDVARVPFFGKVLSRSAGQGLLAEEGDEGEEAGAEMSPHDDESPSADLAAEPATDGADYALEDAEEVPAMEPEGAIEDEVAAVADSHDDVHDFGSSASLLLHDDSRKEEVAEAPGARGADDAGDDKVDVVMASPIESPAYDAPARETFADDVEMPQVGDGDAFLSRLPISRMEDAAAREEPFVSAASSDGFFGSQPDSEDVLPSIRAMGRPDDLIPASRSVDVPTMEAGEYETTGGEGSIIRDNAELAAAEESGGDLASEEVSVLEPEETKKDDVVADNAAAAANEKTVSGDELFNALFAHKDEVAEGLSAFVAEADGADVLELKRADYGMEDVSEAPVADDAARAPWFGTVSSDRGLSYGDVESSTEDSILDIRHEHLHEPEQSDEAAEVPVKASAGGEDHAEEEETDVVAEKDEEVQAAPEPSSLLEMGTSVPLPPTELLRDAPQRPVESRRVAWMGRAWRKSTKVFEVAQNRATLDSEGATVRDEVAPLPFAEPERPEEFAGSGSLPWSDQPVGGSAAPASQEVEEEDHDDEEHDDVFGEHHDVLEVTGTRIKDHGDEPHGDEPMRLHKTQRSPGGRQAWFEDDYKKEKGEMLRAGRSVDGADDKNPIALRDDGKTDKQRALEEAKKGGKTRGFVSMELVVNGDMCVTATVRCDPLNMTRPSSE